MYILTPILNCSWILTESICISKKKQQHTSPQYKNAPQKMRWAAEKRISHLSSSIHKAGVSSGLLEIHSLLQFYWLQTKDEWDRDQRERKRTLEIEEKQNGKSERWIDFYVFIWICTKIAAASIVVWSYKTHIIFSLYFYSSWFVVFFCVENSLFLSFSLCVCVYGIRREIYRNSITLEPLTLDIDSEPMNIWNSIGWKQLCWKFIVFFPHSFSHSYGNVISEFQNGK